MFCSKENCSPRKILPFLALSAVVFWLIWFGAGSLLNKSDVEQGLERVSDQLNEIGKQYGRNVKLIHGDITMEGWGYNKKAVVNNIEVEISVTLDPIKVTLSTEKMVVASDPVDFRRLVMRVPGVVTIAQNGTAFSAIEFSEPLMFTYKEVADAKGETFQNNIYLPKKIALLKSNPSGGFVPEEQGMVLSFAEIPALSFISSPLGKSSTTTYKFSGLTVTDSGQNMIAVGNVESDITKNPGDAEGRITSKNLFKASDVVLYREGTPTKPYAINMDADITIDQNPPAAPAEEKSPERQDLSNNLGPDENRDVTLNEFNLASPDFKLAMNGKFANIKGDPLPSGDMVINIDNLPGFMASELVTNLNMGSMDKVMAKVTGQPVAGQTAVTIPLKREKGGTLHIGQTTFEEMMATMFTGNMLPAPPAGERMPDFPSSSPAEPVPPVDLPVSAPKP